MDGIILVNKQKDVTSRDVVNDLMHILNTKKIGHTGTLDPLATGLMIVCVGNTTKLCELLTSEYKEYIAEIKLGIKTDTLDITGNILQTSEYNVLKNDIEKVLSSFIGISKQTVPIYSAIKINGKKLYQYARNNEEVSLPIRDIEIKEIELISYEKDIIKFRAIVSKGTYIRSLIMDICTKLNTIGTMNNLIRTKQGKYDIKDSYTIEQIKEKKYRFLSKEEVLNDLETIDIDEELYNKVINGAIINKIFNNDIASLKYNNKIIAIYKTYEKDKTLAKPFKMFIN